MTERDWPWSALQMDPTMDVRAIKSAYARLLKQTRPDQDAVAYQRLREAYDHALEWAPLLVERDDAANGADVTYDEASPWQPQPYAEVVVRFDDGPPVPTFEHDRSAEPPYAPAADTYLEQNDSQQALADLLARCEGPDDVRLAPLIAAELKVLPLDQESDAAVMTAQWVLANPGAPVAVLSLLAQRFDWTRDFRIGSRLEASEVAALRELTSGLAIRAGQWRGEVRPLGPEHQQAWAFCGLMATHATLAWLLALLWPHSLLQKLRNWRGFALALTPELRERALRRVQACEAARWMLMALAAGMVLTMQHAPEGHRMQFLPAGIDPWIGFIALEIMVAGALLCYLELHRVPDALVRPLVSRMMRAKLLWQWREWIGVGGCVLVLMGVAASRRDELSALYSLWMIIGGAAAVWGLFFTEGEEFLVRVVMWVLLCVAFMDPRQAWADSAAALAAVAGLVLGICLIATRRFEEKLETLLFSPGDPAEDPVRKNILALMAYAVLVVLAMPIMEARRGQAAVAFRFMLVALCWSMVTLMSPYWPLLILWLPARIARPALESLGWKLVRSRLAMVAR